MIAQDILSQQHRNASMTNTVDEALGIMDQNRTRHLPLVKSKAYLTIIDEKLLRTLKPGISISELTKAGVREFVRAQDHILEVAKKMYNQSLTIMPVLDDEDSYLGVITLEGLWEAMISTYDLNSEGSLLIVEVQQQDFYLSELLRILEQESIHIFSVLVSKENYPEIEITLKTDIKDINTILQTLERYSYQVKAYYENDNYSHQLKDRYESLLSFLNV